MFSQTVPLLISKQNKHSPQEIVGVSKNAQATFSPQPAALSAPEKNSTLTDRMTQLERARLVIEENKIGMDPKLDTFTVMGSEHTHVVTLFPKDLFRHFHN